jgi:hypothetical protein
VTCFTLVVETAVFGFGGTSFLLAGFVEAK